MPSNNEARLLAEQENAICIPYNQVEGNCDGLVSWWLRSRLQGKDIWRNKYFDKVNVVAPLGGSSSGARPVATDHFNPDTGLLERTDKGLAKARSLQALFYNSRDDRAYITHGTRSDKSGKPDKVVAVFSGHEGPHAISDFSTTGDNAGNIGRSFVKASLAGNAAKYTVTSTTGHALGIDCLASPAVRYFDPNIGEFIFTNVAALVRWWRTCYQNRGTGGGAFAIMLNVYNADFYRRA